MSWQAVKWATTQVPMGLVKLPARAVLAVYAEAADENGRTSYQSHVTVAWRLGCTPRNVADHVEALVGSGLLVVSPDQSAVAHISPDNRPVVYDLPIDWVRTDTLDEFREHERERRRRYRKPKTEAAEPVAAIERYEDSRGHGMQISSYRTVERYEESFHRGMKDSAPRYEESFRTGMKNTSCKPSLKPPVEPPLNSLRHVSDASATAPADANSTETHVDALCRRLHQHVEANGLSADPPVIDRTWQRSARAIIQIDGREPHKALNLIDWCQKDPFWSGVIHDMPSFRRNYKKIHTKAMNEWRNKKTQPNTSTPRADQKIHDTVERGARLAQHAATQNPYGPPPEAITARQSFFPTPELETKHNWENHAA